VNDGTVQVALREGHAPTAEYVSRLRRELPAAFPEAVFYFSQPADMVTQILNFGLPAQINVRTVGYDRTNNLRVAREIQKRLARRSTASATCTSSRRPDAPSFLTRIDRTRAAELGLNASTIAEQHKHQSELLGAGDAELLDRPPIRDPLLHRGADARGPGRLAQRSRQHPPCRQRSPTVPRSVACRCRVSSATVATFTRQSVPTNANQANIQPVYEVYAGVQGRDLGRVADDIRAAVSDLQKQMAPGNRIEIVGQIQSMDLAFRNLGGGLLFAAVLVYLLMVVNYQNFGDPFVVLLALPATLCGVVVMLFATGTTLSVPSLMGAIMAVGVASANSILLVTFAREQRDAGLDARAAAIAAGHTRIRPALMTAAAMIVGMIPDGNRRRRRGTECGAGPCRGRRPAVRHADDVAGRALPVRLAARRSQCEGRRLQGATAMTSTPGASGRDPPLRAGVCHRGRRLAVARAKRRRAKDAADLRLAVVPTAFGWPTCALSAKKGQCGFPPPTTAFAAANVFARASGYIDHRNADIGDHVKAGDLLATIVAPELDHQITQAEATLVHAPGSAASGRSQSGTGACHMGP
jgi:hypothetical protein